VTRRRHRDSPRRFGLDAVTVARPSSPFLLKFRDRQSIRNSMGTPAVSRSRRRPGEHAQEIAERAARGAEGERKVGAILENLSPDWHVLHGVWLGRGDIDHVLVGPGGVFTVETKSNRGQIPVDQIDPRMLSQAYAEARVLEKVSGLDVTPLLVFSETFLIGSVPAHRQGVTVLPARMLAPFMARRRPTLAPEEATEIAKRLRLALELDALGGRDGDQD
jgi:hypothetical protein